MIVDDYTRYAFDGEIDLEKVRAMNQGRSVIYEEGLTELIKGNAGKRLFATTDYREGISNSEITFICVGTPQGDDGSIDLGYIVSASRSLGEALKEKDGFHVVVVKSTVVPKTTESVVIPEIEKASKRKVGEGFGCAMNPEFLREGNAVHDFFHPDRVVVGGYDERSKDEVSRLYDTLGCPVLRTDLRTAEMIKYTSNAFLATKISYSNEIGNICKLAGIDTYKVMEGVGMDFRISPYFLNSGAGFGGSCFGKDVNALIGFARKNGYVPKILDSVLEVNESQPLKMVEMLEEVLGGLDGKRIAVLGLAFKGGTDDIRDSRAVPMIRKLLEQGSRVAAYDPKANKFMMTVFPEEDVEYHQNASSALKEAEGCLVCTDWPEFEKLDTEFDAMKRRVVVDGRHIIIRRDGIEYHGLCW